MRSSHQKVGDIHTLENRLVFSANVVYYYKHIFPTAFLISGLLWVQPVKVKKTRNVLHAIEKLSPRIKNFAYITAKLMLV